MDDVLSYIPWLLGAGGIVVPSTGRAVLSVCALALAWLLWILHPRRYAVHNLPGPPSPGWLLGNLEQMADAEAGDFLDGLFAKYGPTVVFADLFGRTRVASVDPSFINHILRDSVGYQKDSLTQSVVGVFAPGTGVFAAEGDVHKRQRRVILPVFSQHTVAQFHSVFLDKSYELRDRFLADKEASGADHLPGVELDVVNWTRRLTWDIIGITAFDYQFDSIQRSDNELYEAMHRAFDVTDTETPWVMLQTLFPILRQLRTPTGRVFLNLEQIMGRIAANIVRKKKKAVLETIKSEGKEQVDKEAVEGNNLIAKIVRANLAADVPASQRLSDKEVADQVGTFIVAGSLTIATALTWIFHEIARNPKIQTKLRNELLTVSDERPSAATLNELPYLDAVTKEALRLYCPATDVSKVATKPVDIVPLSMPVSGRDGSMISEVLFEKGVEVMIPIVNVNRSKAVWGEDAHEFWPERWLRESPVSDAAKAYDSAWGNLLTFSAGPRSCLGYRFAIDELKAMTFVLVRAFAFAPVLPDDQLHRFSMLAQTPKIKGRLHEGDKWPLFVTPYVPPPA